MRNLIITVVTLAIFGITANGISLAQNAAENPFENKNYEKIEFKKLKKAKAEEFQAKAVETTVGLGPVLDEPYLLKDKSIDENHYAVVELRQPGQTKDDADEKIYAYILKDSPVMEMYRNYGTGERLKRTWEKDSGVQVWGTIYHIGGERFPVAMVIEKIQATQKMPKGNLRYSITVSQFENKAGWHGHWDVGDGFTEIMTDALQDCGWFIVLGDKEMRQEAMNEQDFAASGRVTQGKKTPKTGRMTPAQLLVKGAITHVQDSTTGGSGGINIKGINLGGAKDTAEINITIYLVNSETGQVKASANVIGKSDRKAGRLGYYGSKLGGLTGGGSGFKKDNVGKACEDAVAQAVDFLIQQLEKIPWEGTVLLVKPEEIVINRGSREGVHTGQRFTVGKVEELVDQDTGEVLDSEMTKVGTIEITTVKEKVAYGKPLEGADKIEKGMTVLFEK